VLGGAVLVVLFVFYSCSSKASSDPSSLPTESPKATVTGVVSTAALTSPEASESPSPTAQPSDSPTPAVVTPADPKLCTDAEISVVAKAAKNPTTVGTGTVLYLLVKNIGTRTCTRDIGPDMQELWVVHGTERVWSSDDCDAPRGNNLKSFSPGLELSFNIDWNGKYSTSCSDTTPKHADGIKAPAGSYNVLARVGTKQSAPVKLTIN
jgi:hypothetical protein